MTTYAFPLPAHPAVEINGTDAVFPVRRIFCVGRNYADHAREMGNDPDREPPFFFTKPADSIVADGAKIPFPLATSNLHHEAELTIAIGTAGTGILASDALAHVFGYAASNDLTRRDLQNDAKAARRPWDMAKGFDNSAVIGAIAPASVIGHPAQAKLTAHVAGARRQSSDIDQMIWPVADIIAYLSNLVTLQPGDLIMTGTPAGVGQILPGETCKVEIAGIGTATVTVG